MNPPLSALELLWLIAGTLFFFVLINAVGGYLSRAWKRRRTR